MNVNKIVIATVLSLAFIPAFASTKVLSCMSINKTFHHCDLTDADQREIRLTKYKLGNCHLDNAWGVDSRGIWVDKGCGAEFEYGPLAQSYRPPSTSSTTVIIAPAPGFVAATLASAYIFNHSYHGGHHGHHNYHGHHNSHHGHHR